MKRFFVTSDSFVIALPAWAEIEIKEVTSPAGIKAWLVEDHSIPFTALELRFRGGTSLDDPDKRGAVYLMSGLIEEGAGEMDARTYARELEVAWPRRSVQSRDRRYRFDLGAVPDREPR